MGSVTITLMGPPQLQHAGDVQPWPSRKVLLLLSYLLLEPGRHTRDELAGLFWPESAPGVARSALRTVLTQLRRLLPDRLRVEGSLVDLHLLPGDTVDVLSDDVALSDQPFLLGIDVLEEGTLQEWLAAIRAYLQLQHRSRLQRQAQQLERTGQLGAARDLTERWFALDRTDEQATRALITVCQRLGDAGQVQDVYERHRHALAYDVGAQPSSEIQALVPAGTYTLRASMPGYTAATTSVTVSVGVTATAGAMSLARIVTTVATGHVRGTVTLDASSDASGVTISVPGTSYASTTDAAGAYSLDLPAGTYTLRASVPGYAAQTTSVTVTVEGSVTARALTLTRILMAGHVSGTVSLEGTDDASGISVSVPGTSYAATTDATGAYGLDLPAGTYTLRASAPGFAAATTSVNVTLGGSVTASPLSLTKVNVGTPTQPAPAVTGLSPQTVGRGDLVTITGSNFGAVQGAGVVRIGGAEVAQYVSWSDTQIQVRLSSSTPSGSVPVTVVVGASESTPAPLQVLVPAIRPIAGGAFYSVAVTQYGTIQGWAKYGDSAATPPVGLNSVVAVSAALTTVSGSTSESTVLALRSDGTVVGWGDNTSGQATVPASLSKVVQVAAGTRHSVALKTDGTVVAWGDNSKGETRVPSELSGVVAVAAGNDFSLALKRDGTVVAWGDNFWGQTGVPSGLTDVVAVAAGYVHSVALKRDGTVVAWGRNSAQQTNVPSGLSGVVAIAAGATHTLALKLDGTVVVWGYAMGQTATPAGLSVLLP